MPRSKSPKAASEADLKRLHALTAKALLAATKKALKSGEVSAALISQNIALLKLTDTRDPSRPQKKDTLKELLPDLHNFMHPDFDVPAATPAPPKLPPEQAIEETVSSTAKPGKPTGKPDASNPLREGEKADHYGSGRF